jgi:hypothetical protein
MADLNINKSDNIILQEDVGQNLVVNGGFESVPSFTAATTISNVWINGTASGSATDDTWRWAAETTGAAGSRSCQFDSSTFNSGSNSMKLSTLATSSAINVSIFPSSNTTNTPHYGIPVYPGTTYILSFYLKTNYTSGDSNDGAFVSLITRKPDNTSGTTQVSTKVKITADWTQYTISTTPSAGFTLLQIRLGIIGNTGTATLIMDAWFDDLTLYAMTPNGNVAIPVGVVVAPGIQNINGPKIWS